MASGAPGWISTSRGSNTYDYWPRNQVRKFFFFFGPARTGSGCFGEGLSRTLEKGFGPKTTWSRDYIEWTINEWPLKDRKNILQLLSRVMSLWARKRDQSQERFRNGSGYQSRIVNRPYCGRKTQLYRFPLPPPFSLSLSSAFMFFYSTSLIAKRDLST